MTRRRARTAFEDSGIGNSGTMESGAFNTSEQLAAFGR
jgi:hypothetical protein